MALRWLTSLIRSVSAAALLMLLSSPMLATDASGNVVWKENYRPYGERINNEAASSNNKLWFAGKSQDIASGLSYMGARYYDPVAGRFMGIDPQAVDVENLHSFNRYAYANNNPYKFVDPDGHTAIDVVFLGYDLYKLGEAVYTGVGVQQAAIDVALSVVGVASPVPGTGQAIKAARATSQAVVIGSNVRDATRGASSLPVIKPGTKEWDAAIRTLTETSKGKINVRTETASEAKALLREARGGMDRRKQYTAETDPYRKGYEVHNDQNARELGAGNDLQHLKWRDGKAGGHIYFDKPN